MYIYIVYMYTPYIHICIDTFMNYEYIYIYIYIYTHVYTNTHIHLIPKDSSNK